jgi:hypothetical protein
VLQRLPIGEMRRCFAVAGGGGVGLDPLAADDDGGAGMKARGQGLDTGDLTRRTGDRAPAAGVEGGRGRGRGSRHC